MKITFDFSKEDIAYLQSDEDGVFLEKLRGTCVNMMNKVLDNNRNGTIKKVCIEEA